MMELMVQFTSGETADEWNFGKCLCHTHDDEHCEKLAFEASKKVFGTKNRNIFISLSM